MTELAISLVPVDKLVPYGKNAKKHPADQIAVLKQSILKNGWTQPIVVDGDYVVVIGHGRRLAALEIQKDMNAGGAAWVDYRIPVVVRSDLTPAEIDALRLSDNRVTSTSYDVGFLQEEIARLYTDTDVDVSTLGFSTKELDFLNDLKIGEIDLGAFADDMSTAISEAKESSAKKVAEIEATTSPIHEAFGFKVMSVNEIRRTKKFMAQISAETGKSGAEALMGFFDEMGIAK